MRLKISTPVLFQCLKSPQQIEVTIVIFLQVTNMESRSNRNMRPCPSVGRPPKNGKKLQKEIEIDRLNDIIKKVGKSTLKWSLKREWLIVSKLYYGLSSVSPQYVRAIYNFYRSHTSETAKENDDSSTTNKNKKQCDNEGRTINKSSIDDAVEFENLFSHDSLQAWGRN